MMTQIVAYIIFGVLIGYIAMGVYSIEKTLHSQISQSYCLEAAIEDL